MEGLYRLMQQDYTKSSMHLNPPLVAMTLVVMISLYSLGVSTVGLFFAGSFLALIVLTYHPLVPGMRRTWRIHLIMGVFIFLRRLDYLTSKLLGRQPFPLNIVSKQLPIIRDKTKLPRSASFGQVKVTREEIAGVPVIVYRPYKMASPSPALVFMRGAGFVMGNADLFDWTVYEYAKKTNIMAVLTNCCQAPQHPFPEPFNENLEVTRYILQHGADLGIDVENVGVGGDSAGAHFAAAVATTLANEEDSDLPCLKFQVLQVPTLQIFDLRLPSYQDYHKFTSFIDAHGIAVNYALYMGFDGERLAAAASILADNAHISPELRDSKYADYISVKRLPIPYRKPKRPLPPLTSTLHHDPRIIAEIARHVLDPRMSPLMVPDLSRMPPTFIEIAEFDIFRDDGFLYASRLSEAGVKVQVHFSENGFHCDAAKLLPDFLTVESGKKTLSAASDFILRILHRQKEPKFG